MKRVCRFTTLLRFRKVVFLLWLIIVSLQIQAQIPNGYYQTAENKTGAALKNALFTIIKDHNVISYSAIWSAFSTTDRLPNGKIVDIYSSKEWTYDAQKCGNYQKEGDCYNREHSFPKSWFADATPMYSDLFHLYPSDGYVNGIRGNLTWGEVGTANYVSTNGCKRGNNVFPGYNGTVFEPADEYKGDLARTYFYFATRYEDKIAGWKNNDNDASASLAGNSYPAYQAWFINLLAKWHNQDPVSQKEIDRNNAIFAIQGNRNPFIDHPEFAGLIWNFSTTGVSTITGSIVTTSGVTFAYLLNSDFNNCGSHGWSVVTISGSKRWVCTNGYMEVNGYISSSSTAPGTESWFISPQIVISISGLGLVNFKSYCRYTDNGIAHPQIQVFYSTNYVSGSDPALASWHSISGVTFPAANSQVMQSSATGTITGLSAGSISFGFRYKSSGSSSNSSALWRVDDFNFQIAGNTVSGVTTVIGVVTSPGPAVLPPAPVAVGVTFLGFAQTVIAANLSTYYPDFETNNLRFSSFTDQTDLAAHIQLSEDGALIYSIAGLDFDAQDSYTYEICDNYNQCSSARMVFLLQHTQSATVTTVGYNAMFLRDSIIQTVYNTALSGNVSTLLSGGNLVSRYFVATTVGATYRFQLKTNGDFTWIPPFDYRGTIALPVKACDITSCTSGMLIFNVVKPNSKPKALDDTLKVELNKSKSGTLKSLVSDMDGDSLRFITYNGAVSEKGRLQLYANGLYTFIPALDFVGTAPYVYTVCDSTLCDSAILLFVVQNKLSTAHHALEKALEAVLDNKNQQIIIFTKHTGIIDFAFVDIMGHSLPYTTVGSYSDRKVLKLFNWRPGFYVCYVKGEHWSQIIKMYIE